MRNSLRIALALGLALLLAAPLLAVEDSGILHPRLATVLVSHLNVRAEPGVRHRILGTLRRGAEVRFGAKTLRRGWVRISVPSRAMQGWVLMRLLQPLPEQELPPLAPATYAVVRSVFLNLRTGPGTKHDIVRALPRGTHLTLSNTPKTAGKKSAPRRRGKKAGYPPSTCGFTNRRRCP